MAALLVGILLVGEISAGSTRVRRLGPRTVRMSSASVFRPQAATELITLAAVTDRGQRASERQRARADELIAELESIAYTVGDIAGEWELVYASSEAVYRASPFFAAFRKLTRDMETIVRPLGSPSNSLAEAIFRITDAVPYKDVGVARQTINATHLVSRVQLSINIFDALVPRSTSTMTSTAAILDASMAEMPQGPILTRLRVEQTQVLESSLGELLPALAIDQIAFPTTDVFERLRPGSSEISLQTTFLSDNMRISRYTLDGSSALDATGGRDTEAKGGAFVWVRVASPPGNA